MIVALLLAAAAAQPVRTAVDAERQFAGDAQTIGQWTAFKKWAEHDAVVFTPQAAWAREVLPKKDPLKAITWRPAHSYVSCDGRIAVKSARPTGQIADVFNTLRREGEEKILTGSEPASLEHRLNDFVGRARVSG